MKYLLLLLLIALVWLLLRPRSRSGGKPPPAERPEEAMVACAHCGVFLPRSEALAAGGRHYCSEGHRDAGSGGR